MLFLLRKIRRKLMEKNKFTTYLLYAIGEIILVVIGILIAVNINNWNENVNNRKSELKYLSNIQLDLEKDIILLEEVIAYRKQKKVGADLLIGHMNGVPIADVDQVAYHAFNSLIERRFSPNNTTFTELSNSGNLNLISKDTIKILLLELQNNYLRNLQMIEHETFDYREYVSRPLTNHIDLNRLTPLYLGEKTAKDLKLTAQDFEPLLQDLKYKNGLQIMSDMSAGFRPLYESIQTKSEKIIELIDLELQKN